MSVGLLILALVLFIGLVVVHEFGHYIVARRNGVKAEEFAIFFPPRIWHRKLKSGLDFSINLIPAGGFVRLKGEHDSDTAPGSFGASSTWAKTKIMLAGIGMNLISAFVLFTILAIVGMPQLVSNQFTVKSDTKILKNEVLVGEVESNSPASYAGLKDADQLLSISTSKKTTQITGAANLPALTKEDAGQAVTIQAEREGKLFVVHTTLRTTNAVNTHNAQTTCTKDGNCIGYLGIAPSDYTLRRSTWSAPIVGAGLTGQLAVLTVKALGSAIAGLAKGNTAQATANVAGPVGIYVLIKDGSILGYQFILMIMAVISLSLAIMNTLPIPALDGGKLFVTLIARLFHTKLSEKAEAIIYGSGFAILIILLILITIVDVRRH